MTGVFESNPVSPGDARSRAVVACCTELQQESRTTPPTSGPTYKDDLKPAAMEETISRQSSPTQNEYEADLQQATTASLSTDLSRNDYDEELQLAMALVRSEDVTPAKITNRNAIITPYSRDTTTIGKLGQSGGSKKLPPPNLSDTTFFGSPHPPSAAVGSAMGQ